MKKTNKLAIYTILILAIIFIAALLMNMDERERRKELLESSQIVLRWEDGEETLSLEDIRLAGEETFKGTLDTSSSDPSEHQYIGVQLSSILMIYLKADYSEWEKVVVSGADGFSVAYGRDEVQQSGNLYLAYMEDGEYLGDMDSGGRGPYETIILSDMFSNRRCKWVVEIEVQE
ncbi:MAG: hypothetical protein NUK57_03035 [Gudongella sp.]|nr:hypothetical protein [Gudongella sp.]